ncbi:MAG: hypothetical protein CL609_04930 [Anaerolineaceae bacterium]|nr:hypothetical protein [Anaerolineaceae bacterium]
MTAQQPDKIFIDGQEQPLFSNPLEDYFTLTNFNPSFMSPHTANWRGYVASWEIINQKLYLVSLSGWKVNPDTPGKLEEVDSQIVFPDESPPIFAKWFTGRLIVPQGKMMQYIHMGYESIYEREIHYHVKNGEIISQNEINNAHRRCC